MRTPHQYARHHAERFRHQLVELLRIPSVSTMPDHAGDVQRAAEWLIEDMERIGLTARIYQQEGYLPLVYGEWLGAGEDAPTALVYCHYDVQPAFLEDGWDTEPFTPTERDGRIYARGAVDSKSHVIANLKAVEALLMADDPCPMNMKLLFEGEEESGSEHIFRFVAQNKVLLKADVCIVSDGSLPDVNQPVLDYGLRGIITTELVVTGPQRDLHSGHYGGNVHNPIQALVEILTQLHDTDGHVMVPGFYDGVLPLTDEERDVLSEIQPWIEAEWKAVPNAPQPWGEPEFRLHERIGVRPTLEINGISGGYAGEGFKTVIPAKALAKISCRLVPDQNPDAVLKALQETITRLTPPTVRSELRVLEEGSLGIILDRHAPSMRAAARAYEKGWGVKPIYSREGGSIPVVSAFQRDLQIPIVLLPFGYKGCGAHSTNEHVYIEMFHKGIDTAIYFYQEFAAMQRMD
jgi:acetylornithine deacetylase/succinyl-diaminopimelate desuccinylase-like protein